MPAEGDVLLAEVDAFNAEACRLPAGQVHAGRRGQEALDARPDAEVNRYVPTSFLGRDLDVQVARQQAVAQRRIGQLAVDGQAQNAAAVVIGASIRAVVDVEAVDFAGEAQSIASDVESHAVVHGGDDIGGHDHHRSWLCGLRGHLGFMLGHLGFMLGRKALLQGIVLRLGDGAVGEKNIQQVGDGAGRRGCLHGRGRLAEGPGGNETKKSQQSQGAKSAEPAPGWTNSDPSVRNKQSFCHRGLSRCFW